MERKKRALKRVLLLLAVLLFIAQAEAYSLTPKQAADKYIHWYAAEGTEQIMQLDENYLTKYHLCANGEELLLLRSDFKLLRGWNSTKLYAIEGGGAAMLTIYYESGADISLAFGRVNTPGAQRLLLQKTDDTGEFTHALTPEETAAHHSGICFLKIVGRSDMTHWFQFEKYQFLRVFNEDGSLLHELPVEYLSMNYDNR